MNQVRGLEAWRWLFILEGAPSCLCAILVFFFYPDFPETASWLSADERDLATERIKGIASLGHAKITWEDAKDTLTDWRLYLHYLVYISISVPFSSISLFAPTIVSGLGYEGLNAQLFTVPPYAIAFVITIIVSWQSDKREMRSWGAFYSLAIAGISFLVQGVFIQPIVPIPTALTRYTGALPSHAFKARYGLLCVAVAFSFASIPPLLSWLTANLRNTGAATLAVPLNVSIGQFGQIIGMCAVFSVPAMCADELIAGVYIFKSSEAPGYPTGHYTNAAFLILGSLVVVVLRIVYTRRNRRLQPGERQWKL